MYQPMIFTGTRGISRMSLNAGANKWASRAVVVLQLAAWSAVGVVLLQKGVSSLQKAQQPRNSSLEKNNITAVEILKMVKIQDDDRLAVIPIGESNGKRRSGDETEMRMEKFEESKDSEWGQSFDSTELAKLETSLKSNDWSEGTIVAGDSNVAAFEEELTKNSRGKVAKSSTRENLKILHDVNDQSNRNLIVPEVTDQTVSVESSENIPKQHTRDKENIDTDKSRSSDVSLNSNSLNTNNRVRVDDVIENNFHHEISKEMEESRLNLPIIRHKMDHSRDTEIPDGQDSQEINNLDGKYADSNSNETQPVTSHTRKQNSSWDSRRKFRVMPLSSGGAAAAIAMVAVGAVMLVLGPAVIILRALDERRQERRFLKLSGQDDLPPSYEQATLMDEAPRYSTLSLNTIFGPPPPPSPTPATSARIHPV